MLKWTLLDEKIYKRPEWGNPMPVPHNNFPHHYHNKENYAYEEQVPGFVHQDLTIENLVRQAFIHLGKYGTFSKGDFWSQFKVTGKMILLDQEKKELVDGIYEGVSIAWRNNFIIFM